MKNFSWVDSASVFVGIVFPYNLTITCLKVWAIADSKRQGFLGLKEFITAMQVLILH